MCLSVPGKITKIVKDLATVDYGSEMRSGKIVEGNFCVGDYVIIQGGIIVMKVPEDEAKESLAMYQKAVCGS
jgi:hydrogenase assembly chaperone HypC/HupF